jgi:O-antigen ligase
LFPGKPYNINQAGIANLVMLSLSLLYIARRRPKLGPLTWPFAAFLGAGLVSIPFSSSPTAGLRDWSRLAPLLGVYVVSADLLRGKPNRARLWVWMVVASSLWPAVVAVHQFFTNTGYHNVETMPWVNRLLGTLGHPIAYGAYLGLVVVFALYLLREARGRAMRIALAVWVLLSLAFVFLTYSRGPALALAGSLFVFAVLARRESWAARGGLVILAAAFLALNVFGGRLDDLQKPYLYRRLTPVAAAALTPAPTATAAPLPTAAASRLPPPPVDLGATAQTLVQLFVDGRYEEASRMFRPMATPVPAEQFKTGWERLTGASGKIRQVRVTAIAEESGRWVVDITCDGVNAPLELRVWLDGTGTIVGISVPSAPTGMPTPAAGPTPGIVYGVNSFSWRLNLWKFGFDMAMERPITGIGLGAFPDQSPRLVGWRTMPHNDFVRAFTEMGILGLGTYLWLWAALAWSIYKLWRRAPDRAHSLLAATLAAAAAGYAANGLSADMLNYPALGWLFWSLAALPEAFRTRPEAQG